jgi:DNA invertase Pin-like site-specific DNA recombinase
MSNAKKTLSPYAISYLRFSSAIQGKGDSSTRQNASRDRWLKAHPEIPLKREMNDLGLSAFSGKHVATGDLGDFLALCESKEFRAETARRDVYLLVENLDRLSRERILKALAQLEGILASGVKVVTLCDGKTYDSKSLDNMSEVMMAICTMARAHEESANKSRLNSSAWAKKRKEAAEGKKGSAVNNPGWIRESKDGSLEVVPEAAKAIRRVFELACEGKSISAIRSTMNAEKHPTLGFFKTGKKSFWSFVTVKSLFTNRKVLGEFQFHKFEKDENGRYLQCSNGRRIRKAVGEPIKDYLPAIIDPATFAKARKILVDRPSQRGRKSPACLNLFTKVAFDRKTGETIQIHTGGGLTKAAIARGLKNAWTYMPAGIRVGARKGPNWVGWHLEELFFASITQALKVEGSVAGAEADLALAEEQLEEVKKTIKGLEKFLLDSIGKEDFDPSGMRDHLEAQQKVLKFKKEEIEKLKDEIHAGAGAIRLDPKQKDRKKLMEVIRANVQRIDLDCEKQEFRCVLMNGIEYEVKKVEGGWRIKSDHFDPGEKEVFDSIKQLRKIQKKAA